MYMLLTGRHTFGAMRFLAFTRPLLDMISEKYEGALQQKPPTSRKAPCLKLRHGQILEHELSMCGEYLLPACK